MYRVFEDRHDAGRALVPAIRRCDLKNPIILGLPRGGVPVAYEVAVALHAPLDTIVVRKLGAPFQPELAFGAIASGDVRVLNEAVVRHLAIDGASIAKIVARESAELKRREQQYRGDRPYPDLAQYDVVLVDDGLATGATMRAAVQVVQSMSPSTTIVAVPTGSESAVRKVSALVNRVICLESPSEFSAVGQFYRDFAQTTDDEVRELLKKAQQIYVDE
jgi:putative phosphoribosyl transferase